jgi:hypothetical protein
MCFYKSIKDGSIKSFKNTIEGLFERWGVNSKDIKAGDIRPVLEHKDKISYNSIIIKAKGLVKG